MSGIPTTVLETLEFSKQAEGLLSENEFSELIGYLAENPEAGVRSGGNGVEQENVAVFVLSTTTPAQPFPCFFCQFTARAKKTTCPRRNASN